MQLCKLRLCCHFLFRWKRLPPGNFSKQPTLVQSFSNAKNMLTETSFGGFSEHWMVWAWGKFTGMSTLVKPGHFLKCFPLVNDLSHCTMMDWFVNEVHTCPLILLLLMEAVRVCLVFGDDIWRMWCVGVAFTSFLHPLRTRWCFALIFKALREYTFF